MRFITLPCRNDAFNDPGACGAVVSVEKSRGRRAALQTLEERWPRRLTAIVSRARPLEVSACAVVMAPNGAGYLHRLSFGKGHY